MRLGVKPPAGPSCPFFRDLVAFRLSGPGVSQTPFVWIKLDVKFYQICRVLSFSTKVFLVSSICNQVQLHDMEKRYEACVRRVQYQVEHFSSAFLQCEIIDNFSFDHVSSMWNYSGEMFWYDQRRAVLPSQPVCTQVHIGCSRWTEPFNVLMLHVQCYIDGD